MSQINDAYADYEANRGFYQSESPTFNRGSKGVPGRAVERFSRRDVAQKTSDKYGRQRRGGVPTHKTDVDNKLSVGRSTRSTKEDKYVDGRRGKSLGGRLNPASNR